MENTLGDSASSSGASSTAGVPRQQDYCQRQIAGGKSIVVKGFRRYEMLELFESLATIVKDLSRKSEE